MDIDPDNNSRLGISLGLAAVIIMFCLLFAWFVEWI